MNKSINVIIIRRRGEAVANVGVEPGRLDNASVSLNEPVVHGVWNGLTFYH